MLCCFLQPFSTNCTFPFLQLCPRLRFRISCVSEAHTHDIGFCVWPNDTKGSQIRFYTEQNGALHKDMIAFSLTSIPSVRQSNSNPFFPFCLLLRLRPSLRCPSLLSPHQRPFSTVPTTESTTSNCGTSRPSWMFTAVRDGVTPRCHFTHPSCYLSAAWDPNSPRTAMNFNPFETFEGNSPDASGKYPGEGRYKDPVRPDVSFALMQEERKILDDIAANPKPGNVPGAPGCRL